MIDHPEWPDALGSLIGEIDLSNNNRLLIQDLIGPSLGKVFWTEWKAQDAIDDEIMHDPAGGEDPAWWQIDGISAKGGSPEQISCRKWQQRARLWMQFVGPHVWHVADWLIVSRQTNQVWLANLDADGIPKKLRKCRRLDDLVREADKGLRNRRSAAAIRLGPEDEVIVADLGVSHVLVELKTPRALRREGQRMHHCIGHGSYDGRLDDADFRLLSVRDPNGKPLATLELSGHVVRQFRGACNADPSSAVIDLVSAVADEWGWLGLAEAADGRYSPYGRDALVVLEGLEPVRRRPR